MRPRSSSTPHPAWTSTRPDASGQPATTAPRTTRSITGLGSSWSMPPSSWSNSPCMHTAMVWPAICGSRAPSRSRVGTSASMTVRRPTARPVRRSRVVGGFDDEDHPGPRHLRVGAGHVGEEAGQHVHQLVDAADLEGGPDLAQLLVEHPRHHAVEERRPGPEVVGGGALRQSCGGVHAAVGKSAHAPAAQQLDGCSQRALPVPDHGTTIVVTGHYERSTVGSCSPQWLSRR